MSEELNPVSPEKKFIVEVSNENEEVVVGQPETMRMSVTIRA